MSKKLALIILDGWGIGQNDKSNAIANANTPFYDFIESAYPSTQILTHGRNVGLPDGQMGNSEVGHMNLGAGRIVWQMLEKINVDFEQGTFQKFEVYKQIIESSKTKNKLHLIGLISDGGVHSHLNHILNIAQLAAKEGIKTIYIHAILDGRDTDPKSGKDFLTLVQNQLPKEAKIATVIGRYFAMDRDKRWERTAKAYHLLTNLEGEKTAKLLDTISKKYENQLTDEFMEAIVCCDDENAKIAENDTVLFCNFRTDRGRQLTQALSQTDIEEHKMKKLNLNFFTMTVYDETYSLSGTIYGKGDVKLPLGEVLSNANKTQLRAAETEKYPHVTFFFNGGNEQPFKGEERLLVNSPKVATYDLQPEMSALELTEKAQTIINNDKPDFICLNFANPDMVGHTGVYSAIVKAIETVDTCLKNLCETLNFNEYEILVTADHGNAEYAINADGSPNTAHTTNPVRLILFNKGFKLKMGKLANIAPTILQLMGIEQPQEMNETSLLEKNPYTGLF